MNIETALKSALVLFSQIHILATDAKNMSNAMDLVSECVKALETARKEAELNDNNDQ